MTFVSKMFARWGFATTLRATEATISNSGMSITVRWNCARGSVRSTTSQTQCDEPEHDAIRLEVDWQGCRAARSVRHEERGQNQHPDQEPNVDGPTRDTSQTCREQGQETGIQHRA